MLLHREFVDTEEVSVSRFRGGRTGGEAKMAWDCEAVEGVGPVSSLQDVNVDVWIWRGLWLLLASSLMSETSWSDFGSCSGIFDGEASGDARLEPGEDGESVAKRTV